MELELTQMVEMQVCEVVINEYDGLLEAALQEQVAEEIFAD